MVGNIPSLFGNILCKPNFIIKIDNPYFSLGFIGVGNRLGACS